jgi:hypothetical protein
MKPTHLGLPPSSISLTSPILIFLCVFYALNDRSNCTVRTNTNDRYACAGMVYVGLFTVDLHYTVGISSYMVFGFRALPLP